MLVWNLLFLGIVSAKMSGVKYSPSYNENCKTGADLQSDVDIIVGSSNAVLIDYFDICNVAESIRKFTDKNLGIYLDIDAHTFFSIEYDEKKFEKFIDTNLFKSVKGISVSSTSTADGNKQLKNYSRKIKKLLLKKNKKTSVGIKEKITLSNNGYFPGYEGVASGFTRNKDSLDYMLLSVDILGNSIDSSVFASKLFNETFVRMQDLKKPIYLEILPGTGKFSDKSFFDVLRELECRQSGTINYFVGDNFGSDSIFRKSKIYNKLENLSKNTFDCQGHEHIGN
ncbi:hypothetical protein BB561_006266 [Smittium simulii]|uniref:Orn/DAP/Arg decarboxylase 2 N-terminal domain-containing protein n=1 Tax=Smittium simulii TaxID=133385 RepID=A0A2T9Y5H8_9FUNG|nr:hypothetical protein BB561_006266 [Smittium simulii]